MDVKLGDKVTRLLGGEIALPGTVTRIVAEEDYFMFNGLWKFRLSTGAEIDEDLGWDGKTITGSYIKEFKNT